MSQNTENNTKEFTPNDDLDLFFNDFIKRGDVCKEREIVPGFNIKVRVLSTGELISAEAVMRTTPNFPMDVVQKVRCASILSQAIISINGMQVVKEGSSKEEEYSRRSNLYKRLLDMASYVVTKSYELYLEAVTEQSELYTNPEKVSKKIENF